MIYTLPAALSTFREGTVLTFAVRAVDPDEDAPRPPAVIVTTTTN